MILETAALAQNITDTISTYAVQSVADEAQGLVISAAIKMGIGILIALGIPMSSIREVKMIIGAFAGVFEALGAIDLFRAIVLPLSEELQRMTP